MGGQEGRDLPALSPGSVPQSELTFCEQDFTLCSWPSPVSQVRKLRFRGVGPVSYKTDIRTEAWVAPSWPL